MNDLELRVRVLLTLQVSLLGMITSNMRAVLVSWTKTEVRIRIVFERSVSPSEAELVSEIETEVISHMPNHTVNCIAETCSRYENIIPDDGEVLVFQRAPDRD